MTRRKVVEEVLEEMRNLREARLFKTEIANKLNLSYGTILMYLREEEFLRS